MRKSVKLALIIATVLCLTGSVMFLGAMAAMDFDFTKLSTEDFVENVHQITGPFTGISVDTDTADITLLPSPDGACRVECYENEKKPHSVTVEGDTLRIRLQDRRKWYDYIGLSLHRAKVNLYLPGEVYDSLVVKTDTGSVSVPKELAFGTVSISTDTGDIICLASVSGSLKAETDTGDIRIDAQQQQYAHQASGAPTETDIRLETDTGKIRVTNLYCRDLHIEADTGDVYLENVISQVFACETDTGDVKLVYSDALFITIKTETGDVTGTLLSGKIFITKTRRGKVHVPASADNGECKIITATGDIKINIA